VERLAYRGRGLRDDIRDRAGCQSLPKVDIAWGAGRALVVSQVVRVVVLFHPHVAGRVDADDEADVAAGPCSALTAMPNGDRAHGWIGVDGEPNRARGGVPGTTVAKERRSAVRPLQRGAMKPDARLAQAECGKRGAVTGVEAPGIDEIGPPLIGIVIGAGRAGRRRRDSDEKNRSPQNRRD